VKHGLLGLNIEACFHRQLITFLLESVSGTNVGVLQYSVELGTGFGLIQSITQKSLIR